MKSKKWLLGAGAVLSAALLLTACGQSEKKADVPKTFSYVYAMDPSSLDYSVTSKSSTSDVIADVVDGLLENDKYNGENTIFKEITYEIEKVALRSRCCFECSPIINCLWAK